MEVCSCTGLHSAARVCQGQTFDFFLSGVCYHRYGDAKTGF